jgi:hypothetical protein
MRPRSALFPPSWFVTKRGSTGMNTPMAVKIAILQATTMTNGRVTKRALRVVSRRIVVSCFWRVVIFRITEGEKVQPGTQNRKFWIHFTPQRLSGALYQSRSQSDHAVDGRCGVEKVLRTLKSNRELTMKSLPKRLILGYLAINAAVIGVWAQFAPSLFYRSFPGFGHVWVGVDGPFNEHLIRDVGGLNLALAAVFVLAAISLERAIVMAAGIAALLYGVPHVVYHVMNRGELGVADFGAVVGGLAVFAVLPMILLASTDRIGAGQQTLSS